MRQGNTIGVIGFICAVAALFISFCAMPWISFTLWLLGLIFCWIGLSNRPRALAIAGLCISVIPVIFLIVALCVGGALLATMI